LQISTSIAALLSLGGFYSYVLEPGARNSEVRSNAFRSAKNFCPSSMKRPTANIQPMNYYYTFTNWTQKSPPLKKKKN